MGIYSYIFALTTVCPIAVSVMIFMQGRSEIKKRGTKDKLKSRRRSTSLGNALHHLQQIAAPPPRHEVVETLDEDSLHSPVQGEHRRHLLTQTEDIRRGKHVEHLTTLLPSHIEDFD